MKELIINPLTIEADMVSLRAEAEDMVKNKATKKDLETIHSNRHKLKAEKEKLDNPVIVEEKLVEELVEEIIIPNIKLPPIDTNFTGDVIK